MPRPTLGTAPRSIWGCLTGGKPALRQTPPWVFERTAGEMSHCGRGRRLQATVLRSWKPQRSGWETGKHSRQMYHRTPPSPPFPTSCVRWGAGERGSLAGKGCLVSATELSPLGPARTLLLCCAHPPPTWSSLGHNLTPACPSAEPHWPSHEPPAAASREGEYDLPTRPLQAPAGC